jgi:hypothetical protein
MQRIQIFRLNKISSKVMIFFGLLVLIFGLTGLVISVYNGFNIDVFGDWVYLIHVLQGPVFMKIGYSRLMMGRYFIEWNDHKLRYLIPDNLEETEIAIADIRSVNIGFFEITIRLNNGENKIISLKEIRTPELNQIRHKFRKIGELCPAGQ